MAQNPSDPTIFPDLKYPRACRISSAELGVAPKIFISAAAERLRQSNLALLSEEPVANAVRLERVAILEDVETPAARDLLAALPADSSPATRIAACVALIRQGDPRGAARLNASIVVFTWDDKQRVADALARSGTPHGLPILLRLIADNDSDVRRSAVIGLGAVGQPAAIPPLLDILKRESIELVKVAASVALANLGELIDPAIAVTWLQSPNLLEQFRGACALLRQGDHKGMEHLRIMTEKSPSPYSDAAAIALIRSVPAVPFEVIRRLARNNNEELRILAAGALGRSDAGAAFPEMLDMLSRDSSPKVRVAVVDALASNGTPEACRALLKVTEDHEGKLQYEALAALARCGEPVPYETVLEWAGSEDHLFRRAAAQWLAGAHDEPAALEQLLALSSDSSATVRANAAASLGEFDDPRAFDVLLRMRSKNQWEERLGASLGLHIMGDRAVDLLIERIRRSEDEKETLRLIELLDLMGSSSRTRPVILERGRHDPKIWIRVALEAAEAGDKSVSSAVAAAISSNDARIRLTAAKALGSVGDQESIEPLMSLLEDSDWEVRVIAAESLGKTSAPAPGALYEGLRTRGRSVRAGVADVLGKLQLPGSVDVLILALTDPCRLVRANAAGALGAIRDLSAVQPLIEALADSDRGVRNQAAGALRRMGTAEGLAAVRAWTLQRRVAAATQ